MIVRDQVEDLYGLTPLQEGMLFHTLLAPGQGLYFDQVLFELGGGSFNCGALAAAFQAVVGRHPALRTSFVWKLQEKPQQVVLKRLRVPFMVVDFGTVEGPIRRQRIEALLSADRRRGFDLARAPLLRLTLLSGGGPPRLVMSYHHILMDAWSLAVVIGEVKAAYHRLALGEAAGLGPGRSFHAYIRWLAAQEPEAAQSYWRRKLEGMVAPTPLGRDGGHLPLAPLAGYGSQSLALSQEATSALAAAARGQGLTLSTVVQGAWALLLSRLAGAETVVFGITVSGRPHALAAVDEMVGMFINTLPVRIEVVRGETLAGFLARFQAELFELRDFEHSSLVDVQGWSGLPRGLPLFLSNLVFENVPVDAAASPAPVAAAAGRGEGLSLRPLQYNPRTNFPLTLIILPGSRLTLRALYEAAWFDASSARRLLGQWRSLLESFPAQGLTPIAALSPWTAAERQQLLLEWNDRQRLAPELFFHRTVLARARAAPESMALNMDEEWLSRGELATRVGSLAARLQALEVGPERVVALLVERSPAMLVALLAVLAAGGAYLPLDPGYPEERLLMVLADARPDLLLTQHSLASLLPVAGAPPLRLLEDLAASGPGASAEPVAPAEIELSAENLAYVIYTSGSTGRPKGVEIRHGAIAGFLHAMGVEPGLTDSDVLLAVTTLSFDIAALELYLPLVVGARLVLLDRAATASGAEMRAALECYGATVLQATPSSWRLLREAGWVGDAGLKALSGGEALAPELARQIVAGGARLWNLYGPTETTVWSALERFRGPEALSAVPVGRAIDNTALAVVDPTLRLLPLGVAGELVIGGAGLARGYRDQPGLTAERFRPAPPGLAAAPPGARVYRTGDRVRWLPDGRLEFLGRVDQQIKLRGHRIELGDIEATLEELAEVEQAAVVFVPDAADAQLVGFVVPAEEDASLRPERVGERLGEWSRLWSEAYATSRATDWAFDLAGWRSSYSGEPIPSEEMAEWVEATVERILALAPRRLLEIGCGTGLLLFRVAPHCELYRGTDLAAAALSSVQRGLPLAGCEVELREQPAHVFDDLEPGSFDTVVLNSVVQYFPDGDYLLEVLDGVVSRLADNGRLFLGDLRHLSLARAFRTSVEWSRATAETPVADLARRIERALESERELLLAPAFFTALAARLPRIAAVEFLPKRGLARNELTRFRYDVVLRLGASAARPPANRWLAWGRDVDNLAALRRLLAEAQPEVLAVAGVPDARLAEPLRMVYLLAHPVGQTVSDLRAALAAWAASTPAAVEPQELLSWGEQLPYEVELRLPERGEEGTFEVIFYHRHKAQPPAPVAAPRRPAELPPPPPGWCNRPSRSAARPQLEATLRQKLRARLPEAMVPARIVALERLPLTPNGKVDRRTLRAQVDLGVGPVAAALRGPVEEVLASIWAEVLGRAPASSQDSFFDLGGHSLLATRLLARLRKTLRVEVPLASLLEAPTLAAQARRVEAALLAGRGLSAPPLTAESRREPLPLSFAQERLWALAQLAPEDASYNVPYPLRIRGSLAVLALSAAFTRTLARHEVLRSQFTDTVRGPVQRAVAAARVLLPVVDLAGLETEARISHGRRLARREAGRPFDLARGPLLRVALLRFAAADHVLLLSVHHIASDEWSMSILAREVATHYEAVLSGAGPLPPLPVQYADFARWQRGWLSGEVLATQLFYWRERLGVEQSFVVLPWDRQSEPGERPSEGRAARELPAALTDGLKSLARERGATLYMVLLALFKAVLAANAEGERVAIGTAMAERRLPELEELVGLFVNTLVIATPVAGNPTFAQLLERVREGCLGAYVHADLPFDRLVEELLPGRRDGEGRGLFQAFFTFQNVPRFDFEAGELLLEPWFQGSGGAKFDLLLLAVEASGALHLNLLYDRRRFRDSGIQGLADQLTEVAAKVAATPECRLAELSELCRGVAARQRGELAADFQRQRLAGLAALRRPQPIGGGK